MYRVSRYFLEKKVHEGKIWLESKILNYWINDIHSKIMWTYNG